MRIAIATNSLWNFFKFRKSLATSLLKKGNIIYVFTEKKGILEHKYKNIKFIVIPIKRNPFNLFHDLILIFFFFKYFYFLKIEYFLGFSHKINIYGGFVCKILNIKSILNITGLGTAFISNSYLKYLLFFLYKFTGSNNFYYFFHNHYDYKLFLNNKIIVKKNSFIIPGSGIDISKKIVFSKKKRNILVFTFIGRLIYQKGINEFLQAAKIILETSSKKNILFKIIGEIDFNNVSYINKSLLNEFKKRDGFIFKGHLDEINVFKEIISSDCLVFPSYREGLPRTILEFFLHSKPVIASNVPGCNTLVKNNFNGLLCRPRSVKSLVICLNKFIEMSKQKRKKLGLNGRKLVIKKFDENFIINKYLNLIN